MYILGPQGRIQRRGQLESKTNLPNLSDIFDLKVVEQGLTTVIMHVL